MRKFILIASLVLMSANAEAGPSRGLTLASNDQPAAAEQAKPVVTQKAETKSEPVAEKPVSKKRETDEAKARRIAARYGISW